MSELEKTGYRTPEIASLEARAALRHRQADSRLTKIEGAALIALLKEGKVIQDLDLTTTPQNIRHELGKEWSGAFVVKRDGTGVLLMSSTQNDAVWIGLAVDAGTPTVDVWVF